MWQIYYEYDATIYRFFLNEREVAYIEEGYDWATKKTNYFGFVLNKENDYHPINDSSLDSIKIKAVVKAKELGWPINEWPIKE